MSFKKITLAVGSGLGVSALAVHQWDRWRVDCIRDELVREAQIIGSQKIGVDEKITRVPLIYWTEGSFERRELKGIWRDYFAGLFTAAGIDHEWIIGDGVLLDKEFTSNALANFPTLSKEEVEKIKPFTKEKWITLLPDLLKGVSADISSAVFIKGVEDKYKESIIEAVKQKIKGPSGTITPGSPLLTFDEETMQSLKRSFGNEKEIKNLDAGYLLKNHGILGNLQRFFSHRIWYEKAGLDCLEILKKL